MTKYDWMGLGLGAVLLILVTAFCTAVVAATNAWKCSSRWSGTYPTEYKLIGGCRVQVNGKWVPEDRVREF